MMAKSLQYQGRHHAAARGEGGKSGINRRPSPRSSGTLAALALASHSLIAHQQVPGAPFTRAEPVSQRQHRRASNIAGILSSLAASKISRRQPSPNKKRRRNRLYVKATDRKIGCRHRIDAFASTPREVSNHSDHKQQSQQQEGRLVTINREPHGMKIGCSSPDNAGNSQHRAKAAAPIRKKQRRAFMTAHTPPEDEPQIPAASA